MSIQTSRRRREDQLPGGRHGLSRTYVATNQRERLLRAVPEAAHASGYSAMTVDQICQIAGVSKRTFYDHFRNKEDVFVEAYDQLATALLTRVTVAYAAATSPTERIRRALDELLQTLAAHPAAAEMCIVEVLAAEPRALERRNAAMRAFTQLILRAVDEDLDTNRKPPPLVAETVVGGIYEALYSRVRQGRAGELPQLLPELLFAVLVIYLGERVAHEELERLRASDE